MIAARALYAATGDLCPPLRRMTRADAHELNVEPSISVPLCRVCAAPCQGSSPAWAEPRAAAQMK